MMKFKTLTTVLLLMMSTECFGSVWTHLGISWIKRNEDQGSAATAASSTQLFYNVTLGYGFPQGFFVGGQFLRLTLPESSLDTYAWGIKGGLLMRGFELSAAFLPFGNGTDTQGSRSGSGFSVNLGYSWNAFGPVRLGLSATYWSLKFGERNSSPLSPKENFSLIAPQVALGLEF